MRRLSSSGGMHSQSFSEAARAAETKERYAERQRRKLEVYLQQMIRFFIFRADSNRLCRFLELSSLGVRLAAGEDIMAKREY